MDTIQKIDFLLEEFKQVRRTTSDRISVEQFQNIINTLRALQQDVYQLESMQKHQTLVYDLYNQIAENEALTYQNVLEWVYHLLYAEYGYIVQPDESTTWHITYQYPADHTLQIPRTFLNLLAKHNEVILTNTAKPPEDAQLIIKEIHEVFLIPLVIEEQHIGGIYIGRRINSGAWNEQDIAFMQYIAPMIAQALQLSHRLAVD